MLAGLALVAILFGFLIGPQFFSAANLELMARQTAIVCVAALGMTMVIVAGGIDLSEAEVKGPSSTWTYLVNDDPFQNQIGQMLTGPGNCGSASR